ncbi:hypothetical protein HN51_018390 [Arachis hypogaea]|uniref:DUF4220 domain-containing protein n=2 Tax=Arachis hypogaea TaxID=3818 RepID=A0A445BT27_ARAHY|nr:uncharacterized protein LOC112704980 [Arachis hypogaea]QHO29955.1 DUF594 family protein [Arachis hypogaea]RYR41778.1 hypothetical protein Ahy_A08g038184 isoform A [Arachis hypogaea]
MNISLVPGQLQDLWDLWGLEVLMLLSFTMQVILTVFGSRRKDVPGMWIRFTVWFTYLLSASLTKIIIGKLTVIPGSDPDERNIRRELKAMFAPLLLVQIGNPDAITAYSIEDNRLGLRQLLALVLQVAVVIWIVVKSWTQSKLSYLYLPLFVSGLIKYGEVVWALKSAFSKRSGIITIQEIDQEASMPALFRFLPDDIPNIELILKAYYRFISLKPHRENWLYQPLYESLPRMSVDEYAPEDIFKITDSEIGFMYDVLYTKAPIIYTKGGCIFRIVSFFGLVSTFTGFSIIFREAFPHHWKACFIEGMLAGAVLMEIYQIAQLPFTDWAIIQIIKHQSYPFMIPCLRILGPQASNRKRWSNTLAQFNLLSFCLHDKPLKCSKILKFRGIGLGMKKNKSRTRIPFPQELKVLMVEEMRGIDRERGLKPFNQRGEWSLGRYGCLNEFKWSVKRDFDKSITIWHIATDTCYYSDSHNNVANPKAQMAKLLSNYMMYLLALRPHMLSMTTAKIIFQHAFDKLKALLEQKEESIKDEKELCKILRMEWLPQYSISERKSETVVTSKWHMLRDAQRLARNLMLKENKWQIICSVWVEMLCYAAANCSIDYHSEQIRRGGGLITHVWVMLAHKTDKYHISD